MNIRRWFCRCLLLVGLLLSLPIGWVLAEESPAQEPLIVAQDHDWPPFAYENSHGEPEGILVDFWAVLSERLDRPIEFYLTDWSDSIQAVRDGRADVHGGLFYSDRRAEFFTFTENVVPLSAYLFVRSDAQITAVEDLHNASIGVIKDSMEQEYLQTHHPEMVEAVFLDHQTLIHAALEGHLMGFVADYPVGQYLLDELARPTDFRPFLGLYSSHLKLGVPLDNPELRDRLNQALAQVDARERQQIMARWLNTQTVEVLPRWFIPMVVAAIIALLLAGYSLWLRHKSQNLAHTLEVRNQELADSEGLFRGLADSAAVGVYIIRGERFTFVNQALADLFGCPREQVLATPYYEFIHPDDRAVIQQRKQDRLAGKAVPSHYEMRIINAKGEALWIYNSVSVSNLGGHWVSIGVLIDISERKALIEQLALRERQYRTLVDNANDIIFTLNAQGRFQFVSKNWTQMLGHSVDEVLGKDVAEFVYPEDLSGCRDFLQQVLESGEKKAGFEYRVMHKDGSIRWHTANASPLLDDDGMPVVFLGIARDITQRMQAEKTLREQHRFQTLLADLSSDFMAAKTVDKAGMDAQVNALLAEAGRFFGVDRAYLFSFSPEENSVNNTHEWCREGVFPAIDMNQSLSLSTFPWWKERLADSFATGRPIFIPDISAIPGAAERAFLGEEQQIASMICVPIRVADKPEGFLGFDSLTPRSWQGDQPESLVLLANLLGDALTRHKLEQQLLTSSITDALTGLHNRRYLFEQISARLARYQRSHHPFSLVMMDIDFFKKLNDDHGHMAGDAVLRQFADLLCEQIRPFDLCARFGGEEFVLLLDELDASAACDAVERILERVRSCSFHYQNEIISVTASAGVVSVAELIPPPPQPEYLIDAADQRLYEAKRRGRDQVVCSPGAS